MTPPPSQNARGVSDEVLSQLAAGVTSVAGIQPSMLDQRSLRQTLTRRMSARELRHVESYLDLHGSDPAEQAQFLEGVLNGETSFFRDAGVFAEMAQWCKSWFASHTGPMRILSAPCSTGEEPYSIAAMLQREGVALESFTLEAMDLSSAAIAHAKAGVYTGLSLRNVLRPAQEEFLEKHENGWRVKEGLREHVQFSQGNLLEQELPTQGYDLICSRNLMLYQSPAARRRVARSLAQALAPDGRVIVGAADWGLDLNEYFCLEEPIHSFALRLRTAGDAPLVQSMPRSRPAAGPTSKASRRVERATAPMAPMAAMAATESVGRQLADVNELYRNALESYLRGQEPAAEALCRKALYLEPDHIPALELMTRIRRPQASPRIQKALHARLKRHRDAVAEGAAR